MAGREWPVNDFDLTGRVAFVTGASRGIGRQITLGLARAGADVAVVARSGEGLKAVADEVAALGRAAVAIACDVTDRAALQAAAARSLREFGQVDVLVNNAGAVATAGPLTHLEPAGWEASLRVNLDAAVWGCQVFAEHMLGRGSGSVINVTSVAAVVGAPFLAAYSAAKGAVAAFTRTLAAEWASQGVRVNALCPGMTMTDINRMWWEDPEIRRQTSSQVPMQRYAEAGEMAGPAVFLASPASSFMTGQVLVVDGGQSIV
ncbi:SDR family NAD(P)-dependent oxidoreductase [Spirillospora sp. NPDC048911]|uniref:SDR family NAD(P)-dependent oxidoreductase n=1 Tax=Spirillospora sp. NPDC048911 TaxID=3364527 RepID=UPI00371305D0